MAVGFIGICLAEFTPVFNVVGLLLKRPVMIADLILGTTGASAASCAFAGGLAEIFPAAILLENAEFAVRMLAAIVSVSMVLFLFGCIPRLMLAGPLFGFPTCCWCGCCAWS